jgi:hypothetical protein
MIVRISGEDQYELPDTDADELNGLERAVLDIVDGGREAEFAGAYAGLLEFVRSHGQRLDDDDIHASDVILPPDDISFAEAGTEFTGEGLIPD